MSGSGLRSRLMTGSLVWALVVLGGFAWTRVLGSASVQRLLDRSAQ